MSNYNLVTELFDSALSIYQSPDNHNKDVVRFATYILKTMMLDTSYHGDILKPLSSGFELSTSITDTGEMYKHFMNYLSYEVYFMLQKYIESKRYTMLKLKPGNDILYSSIIRTLTNLDKELNHKMCYDFSLARFDMSREFAKKYVYWATNIEMPQSINQWVVDNNYNMVPVDNNTADNPNLDLYRRYMAKHIPRPLIPQDLMFIPDNSGFLPVSNRDVAYYFFGVYPMPTLVKIINSDKYGTDMIFEKVVDVQIITDKLVV